MFCPKCGTENTETASFCRGCGSNISLVPQALTGTLRDPAARDDRPLSRSERRERKRERKRALETAKKPSLDHAVVPFFGGIGFVVVALAIMFFMPGGAEWGFWMFIPAFFMIGGGVSEYLRWQSQKNATQAPAYTPPTTLRAAPPAAAAAELRPPRATTEIYAPGSVTEGTTKLLERDQ